jgi:leucyl aminopeptidase
MEISTCQSLTQRGTADALVLPFWKKDGAAQPAFKDAQELKFTNSIVDIGDFSAKEAEILMVYNPEHKEPRVIFVGLGDKARCNKETVRRSFAEAVKQALAKKLQSINIALPEDLAEAEYTAIEAVMMTNYRFDYRAKKEDRPLLKNVTFIGEIDSFDRLKHEAFSLVKGINFARDLVNGNADEITPQRLADEAEGLDKHYSKIHTKIFDKHHIQKMGMGLFLAVARCSSNDPYFIVIEYKGNPSKEEKIALVGKGITYDTGGLSLKPSSSMETMKCDMAGAGAVLGTMKALAELDVKVNVVGFIAATENSIGSKAYKLGDVYTSYSNTTVEITNTDAEGRLALADCMSYALKEFKPSFMIDLATLTGAAGVALGEVRSPLFSNHDHLAKNLYQSGEDTGEKVWRMPLDDDYKELLSSKIADIKNCGSREGSLAFSAMFLKEFVGQTPWAHLDIAYAAYLSKPKYYHTTPATGYGVRLLVEYLRKHHAS